MRKFASFCLMVVFPLISVFHPAFLSAQDSAPLQVNAKSAVLMEVSTGTILFEQNADEPIEPASFTKVLTLFLVFDSLRQKLAHLQDEVWISEKAWRTGGSKMFVGVDTKVPLEELIKGISVVSGNDACTAAAEHLYGSSDAFVSAMNRRAKELGMHQSHFENPHGLPAEGQITTARDMAKLDLAYLQRFPEALRYHSMREFSFNGITQHNRNRLLIKDPSVDGLKTGYVAAAGYHLSATAERDGMRLLGVVMGADTPAAREREALKLLNYGFRHFTLAKPFPQDQPVTTVKVWKGIKDAVNLYGAEEAILLIPQSKKSGLRWEVQVPDRVSAPVGVEQAVGKIVFFLDDSPVKNVALVAHEEVQKAGLVKQVWQTVLQVPQVKVNWKWAGGISGGALIFFFLVILAAKRRQRRSRAFR